VHLGLSNLVGLVSPLWSAGVLEPSSIGLREAVLKIRKSLAEESGETSSTKLGIVVSSLNELLAVLVVTRFRRLCSELPSKFLPPLIAAEDLETK
jgi:hypothetical protein